jgi:hypothetical protein
MLWPAPTSGVAAGAGEAVALEPAVGLGVADDGLDRGPSAQFAFDGRRALARALGDVDFRREPMAEMAFVDVDAGHGLAGVAFHLRDLAAQRVAVVGKTIDTLTPNS